jgi:2-iminobutanoate/2-iminopropanoate deaminase
MVFLNTKQGFPFSDAVIYSGRVLATVLVGIVPEEEAPIPGGVEAELREIFRQLDAILSLAGVDKRAIASVRLYLQEVNRDIAAVNAIYKEYFGSHPPNRRAYGVDLQRGMLIEAAVLAELPAAP